MSRLCPDSFQNLWRPLYSHFVQYHFILEGTWYSGEMAATHYLCSSGKMTMRVDFVTWGYIIPIDIGNAMSEKSVCGSTSETKEHGSNTPSIVCSF